MRLVVYEARGGAHVQTPVRKWGMYGRDVDVIPGVRAARRSGESQRMICGGFG